MGKASWGNAGAGTPEVQKWAGRMWLIFSLDPAEQPRSWVCNFNPSLRGAARLSTYNLSKSCILGSIL